MSSPIHFAFTVGDDVMAMIPGSITINPTTGADSGTGVSYELFTDFSAKVDYGTATGATLALAKQQVADLCQSVGQVIVAHITTNGKAKITTSDVGLQLIPATPVNEDDECKAPAADKFLAIV
jgi:hypothetical protein